MRRRFFGMGGLVWGGGLLRPNLFPSPGLRRHMGFFFLCRSPSDRNPLRHMP